VQAKIEISINGDKKSVATECLADALIELGYRDDGFAVAVNGEFVPRPSYGEFVLSERDEIDVVAPIAGG